MRSIDLMGGVVAVLSSFLSEAPAGVPGLLHSVNDSYFRRVEAVEFAVKHDDGALPETLSKADLVIVGVSRTSKTPLSMYLAQKGLRVANVPLVLGINPPAELATLADARVYGLIIQTPTLMRIRQNRLQYLGLQGDSDYAVKEHIDSELRFARQFLARHPAWPVIDVTNRAIEETAADILRLYKQRIKEPIPD